jgi:hypothetical protein
MKGNITPEGMTKFISDIGLSLESVSDMTALSHQKKVSVAHSLFKGYCARHKLAIKCSLYG